jgi:hypothetical protein
MNNDRLILDSQKISPTDTLNNTRENVITNKQNQQNKRIGTNTKSKLFKMESE